MLQDVRTDELRGLAQFAFAGDGTLAYVSGSGADGGPAALVLVDREGSVEPVTDELRNYVRPRPTRHTGSPRTWV